MTNQRWTVQGEEREVYSLWHATYKYENNGVYITKGQKYLRYNTKYI